MDTLRLFVVVLCITHVSIAPAQTGELDEDASTINSLVESEETNDRLRMDPLDLRRATVSDLLEIPGISRREAFLIVQAVRSGRIDELQDLRLISGISPRAVELLVPYVYLKRMFRKNVVAGAVRFRGGGQYHDGAWMIGQSRTQVLVISSIPGAPWPSGLLNARWTEKPNSLPRVHAAATMMEDRFHIHVGHLAVQTGTPLLEQGRRPGLFRPSDWRRLNSSSSRVRLGTDDGTALKGAMFAWRSEERRWLTGLLVDPNGDRLTLLSWSEKMGTDLQVNVSWQSTVRGVSWGVSHDGVRSGAKVEFVHLSHAPISCFAFGRWSSEDNIDVLIYLRHLRGVTARGLPRQGSVEEDEDGGTLAFISRPSHRLKWQITADVSRLRSTSDVQHLSWAPAGGISMMSELAVTDRDRVSAEIGASHRRTDSPQRLTFQWNQTMSRSFEWSMTFSSRKEGSGGTAVRTSRLVRCDVQWRSETSSLAMRWLRVDGDPAVQFWQVGLGPSALGTIRPVSGRTSMMQGFVQGLVFGQLLAAFVVTHASTSDEGMTGGEVSSSILLEFRL